MHRALLCAAAALATLTAASSASAQGAEATTSFTAISAGHPFRGAGRTDFRRGGRHFRHIRVGNFYGYGGYDNYGDYDANRSFDPDKWNDWWHERPERAFPRWVWNNQNCTPDRMWYSGSGWRCTP